MKRVLSTAAVILFIVGISPGCTPGTSASGPETIGRRLAPGQHDLSLSVGGKSRDYRLYVPRKVSGVDGVPLVIVLHGGGGWAAQIESMSKMDSEADASGFMVAYPNGTKGLLGYTWNGGDCCGVAMREEADDVGFMSALIDELVRNQGVDPSRVFATGISNGGIMAHRLACELSDKVAAIAPIAGAMMVNRCQPSRPVSVMFFHGTEDKAVKVEGGLHERSQGRRPFPPLDDHIGRWLKANRCPDKSKVTYNKGDTRCETYGPCAEGTEVAVCMISGGGHTWPGGAPIMKRQLGHTTRDISANAAMWDFFEKHPLKGSKTKN